MTDLIRTFTTPVGRIVSGSVHEAQKVIDPTTKLQKTGLDGMPLFEYYIGLAIPKAGEPHWAHTEWGKVLWEVGHGGFPQGQAQQPTFAWKVIDGDSSVPNKANIAPNTRDGYPGNWICSFKTTFMPKTVDATGANAVQPDIFYRGCYAQVGCSVKANGSMQSPGIYLNTQAIAFSAHGEHIHTGPDTTTMGFGQGALPAGASATPLSQPLGQNVPLYSQPPQPAAPQPAAQAQPMAPPPQAAQAPQYTQPMAPPAQPMAPAAAPTAPPAQPMAPAAAPTAPHTAVMAPPQ